MNTEPAFCNGHLQKSRRVVSTSCIETYSVLERVEHAKVFLFTSWLKEEFDFIIIRQIYGEYKKKYRKN